MTEERSDADLKVETTVPGSSSALSTGDACTDPTMSDTSPKSDVYAESARGRRKGATLSPQSRDRIANQLRSMYDQVASQPVPDRFAELIARLDSAERDV
jgi:hypothetical protein